MKYYCDACGRLIDSDEKCLWEQGGIPNPERNCVKCDHYKSHPIPTRIETSNPLIKPPAKKRNAKTSQQLNESLLEAINESLTELAETRAYQRGFSELIAKITSQKTAKALRFTTWHWPMEWDGDFKKVTQNISLAQFKKILKEGKVNESYILIPDSYSNFKDRWQIDFFFDPRRSRPNDFCPFSFTRRPMVRPCFPPMSEDHYEKIIREQVPRKGRGRATPGQLRLVTILWNQLYNRYDDWNAKDGDSASKLFLEIDVEIPLKKIIKCVTKEIALWRKAATPYVAARRGRPESKMRNLRRARAILEANPQLQNLSKAQRAMMIHEELERTQGAKAQEASTILRWYLPK